MYAIDLFVTFSLLSPNDRLPIIGFLTGSYQIVRGILNTPNAIVSRTDGKVWDRETRKWIYYNLKNETDNIENTTGIY